MPSWKLRCAPSSREEHEARTQREPLMRCCVLNIASHGPHLPGSVLRHGQVHERPDAEHARHPKIHACHQARELEPSVANTVAVPACGPGYGQRLDAQAVPNPRVGEGGWQDLVLQLDPEMKPDGGAARASR